MTAANHPIENAADAVNAIAGPVRRLVSIVHTRKGDVEILLDGEGALETVTPARILPGSGINSAFSSWRQWLLRHPRTGEWPTLGTAGDGWTMPAVVKNGDRVCPLLAAIVAREFSQAHWVIDTLDLPRAPTAWRQHAGDLAVRLMRSARLNHLGTDILQVAAALLRQGAELDDLRCLEPGVTKSRSTHGESAPLTCLLFSRDLQPLGADLLVEIIRRHPERAANWSDAAFDGGGPAHVCVMASQEQALGAILDIPGLAERKDACGRTPLSLAEYLHRPGCASLLRAHAARQAAAAVLDEITSNASKTAAQSK